MSCTQPHETGYTPTTNKTTQVPLNVFAHPSQREFIDKSYKINSYIYLIKYISTHPSLRLNQTQKGKPKTDQNRSDQIRPDKIRSEIKDQNEDELDQKQTTIRKTQTRNRHRKEGETGQTRNRYRPDTDTDRQTDKLNWTSNRQTDRQT